MTSAALRRPSFVSLAGLALFVGVTSGACGGATAAANASNTRSDSAHVAAQANEPRTSDPTAAAPAPGNITRPSASASLGTSATPPTTGTSTTGTTSAPGAPGSSAPGNDANANAAAAAEARPASPPSKISARHVLIQWMGSDRAGKSVLRTREQALVVAQEVLRRAKGGEDVGRLAVEYSDEPNAGARGGSLGRFGKGQMVGAFDAVAFKLQVGEVSDIVETPFGFHIIQRTE